MAKINQLDVKAIRSICDAAKDPNVTDAQFWEIANTHLNVYKRALGPKVKKPKRWDEQRPKHKGIGSY